MSFQSTLKTAFENLIEQSYQIAIEVQLRMHDSKMDALYEAFLDNLLTLVEEGQIKASERAVILLFLKDHSMAQKNPNKAKVNRLLADHIPLFGPDDDDNH
jgi:hypothetical protein